MQCKKCGTENRLVSQYCVKCGGPLKSSIDEVSEASREEVQLEKAEKVEQQLLTIMVLLIVITLPLFFLYFFLPEPSAEDMHVSPAFAQAIIPQASVFRTEKFKEEAVLLEVPLEKIRSATYFSTRVDAEEKKSVVLFFDSGRPGREALITKALNWIARHPQTQSYWEAGNRADKKMPLLLLAFLGEGHSSAHPEHGEMIGTALEQMYLPKQNRLTTTQTSEFALAVLAYMENSLMDPFFKYTNRVPQLLEKLKNAQNKKIGSFPRFLGKKNFSEVGAVFALRTLGEAHNAGLTKLSEHELKISKTYLLNLLKSVRKHKVNPQQLQVKAMLIYDLLILNQGKLPKEAYDEINTLIDQLNIHKQETVSVLANHFLLLTLFRSDDQRFFEIKEKIFKAYAKAPDDTAAGWAATETNLMSGLALNDSLATTALILRTYAFPYLYAKFGD